MDSEHSNLVLISLLVKGRSGYSDGNLGHFSTVSKCLSHIFAGHWDAVDLDNQIPRTELFVKTRLLVHYAINCACVLDECEATRSARLLVDDHRHFSDGHFFLLIACMHT